MRPSTAAIRRATPRTLRGDRRFLNATVLGIILLLCACGRDGPVGIDPADPPGEEPGAPPAPKSLVILAGDGQQGNPGRALDQELAVQVVDSHGTGVSNVPVTWTVTAGEGILDGQWGNCDVGPISRVQGVTNHAGLAWVSLMPVWFGPVTVTVHAASLPPVTFTADASDPGAALEIVSGDGQDGALSPSYRTAPFVVRVTDGQGGPVPYVTVNWSLVAGWGHLGPVLSQGPGCAAAEPSTRTLDDGTAAVDLRPGSLGQTVIGAAVAGLAAPPPSFTLDIRMVEIGLDYDGWTGEPGGFMGPYNSSDVTVPRGMLVQFRNQLSSARIVSIVAPSGGTSFDSGPLTAGEVFRFVPNAIGAWEFVDQVSGAKGTLATMLSLKVAYDSLWEYETFSEYSVEIPAGLALEFWNTNRSAHIVSSVVPDGAVPFDSGPMNQGDRTVLTPTARGTWQFVDLVSQAEATVVVR